MMRRQTSHDTRRSGFTLVELLLVLALVVVLAALVSPSLSGTLGKVRLDSAAEQIRTAWIKARLEAMRTGEPVAFQCRLGESTYSLSTLARAAAAQLGSTEVADQEKLADDDYEELGGVTFLQLTLGDGTDPTVDPTIPACLVFQPDGATQDAFAIIQTADGRQRRITLRGLTGAARVDKSDSGAGE